MIFKIQYLRGIAALLVVHHHIQFQFIKAGSPLLLPMAEVGAAGVDIFFVISGFIMWISTYGKSIEPAEFVQMRLIRIFPLYFLASLFLLLVSLLAPALLSTTQFNLEHFTWSVLFVAVQHPVMTQEILPFFIQGWTLNYEMYFYLIFALTLLLGERQRSLALLAVLTLIVLAGLTLPVRQEQFQFYTSTLLLEFVYGLLVGWVYTRGGVVSRQASVLLILAGFAALAVSDLVGVRYGASGMDPSRALLWGVPAAAIVAGAGLGAWQFRGLAHRALSALGDSSYSLYLSHIVTLPVVALFWRLAGGEFSSESAWVLATVMMVSAVTVGWLIFVLVELPLTEVLRSWVKSGRRTRVTPIPAASGAE